MSRWGVVLEYVMGLDWQYSPLVLGLIRDKGHLLRDQVRLAWESSKPLYKERRCINLIKQELRRKSLPSCHRPWAKLPAGPLAPSL